MIWLAAGSSWLVGGRKLGSWRLSQALLWLVGFLSCDFIVSQVGARWFSFFKCCISLLIRSIMWPLLTCAFPVWPLTCLQPCDLLSQKQICDLKILISDYWLISTNCLSTKMSWSSSGRGVLGCHGDAVVVNYGMSFVLFVGLKKKVEKINRLINK